MGKRRKRKQRTSIQQYLISLVILLCIGIVSYFTTMNEGTALADTNVVDSMTTQIASFDINQIPEYTNQPYVYINENQPNFTEKDMTTIAFEKYSDLDKLGRCGTAYSCVGKETMPTKKRGDISKVKPTGWQTTKYDIVEGKYLYNRCHLIGYQLTAENANKKNLITGTRYMNVEGMLPFENQIADYVDDTNHHVLYRVTPIFKEDNLVANGVQMEAKSVEDNGDGVCFHVYVYNVQPGIVIDYTNGQSKLAK